MTAKQKKREKIRVSQRNNKKNNRIISIDKHIFPLSHRRRPKKIIPHTTIYLLNYTTNSTKAQQVISIKIAFRSN